MGGAAKHQLLTEGGLPPRRDQHDSLRDQRPLVDVADVNDEPPPVVVEYGVHGGRELLQGGPHDASPEIDDRAHGLEVEHDPGGAVKTIFHGWPPEAVRDAVGDRDGDSFGC